MKTFTWAALALAGSVFAAPTPQDDDTVSAPSDDASVNNVAPVCTQVNFTVTASASVVNITSSFPLSNLTDLLNAFGAANRISVSGTERISGTYCLPTVRNANNDKLLLHYGSIIVTRGGWQAQGGPGTDFPEYNPQLYEWTSFYNRLGYPTIAFDRLCSGRSSMPDAFLKCQIPYETAVYNGIARQVRAGTSGVLPRSYNFLVYVGNSYGSNTGVNSANADPTAYNEYILTGFTKFVDNDFVGVSMAMLVPAQTFPQFANAPAGYLTSSNEANTIGSFFSSHTQTDYDQRAAEIFFERRSTVTVGQVVTLYGLQVQAPNYRGRVLVLTGEQDQAYCGPGNPSLGDAHCGNQLQQTGTLFPNADYNYKTVDRVGHAIQNFYRSNVVRTIAAQFLAGQEFRGGPPA